MFFYNLFKLLMRKLIALCVLLLSASAAMAQTDKNPAVTKLPGEEKLSTRERAERDFLMPVRRKKQEALSRITASNDPEGTASPELDATAHYTVAAPEARPEEVASPARAERHAALRSRSRATRLSALRHTRTTKTSSRHSKVAKATKASTAKRTAATKHHTKVTKATKVTAHRSTKKAATHKTTAKAKKTATAKHTARHTAAPKKASKTKAKSSHKRRR